MPYQRVNLKSCSDICHPKLKFRRCSNKEQISQFKFNDSFISNTIYVVNFGRNTVKIEENIKSYNKLHVLKITRSFSTIFDSEFLANMGDISLISNTRNNCFTRVKIVDHVVYLYLPKIYLNLIETVEGIKVIRKECVEFQINWKSAPENRLLQLAKRMTVLNELFSNEFMLYSTSYSRLKDLKIILNINEEIESPFDSQVFDIFISRDILSTFIETEQVNKSQALNIIDLIASGLLCRDFGFTDSMRLFPSDDCLCTVGKVIRVTGMFNELYFQHFHNYLSQLIKEGDVDCSFFIHSNILSNWIQQDKECIPSTSVLVQKYNSSYMLEFFNRSFLL